MLRSRTSRPFLDRIIESSIVVFLVASLYSQTNLGLADNGDYARASGWFSSGPVGIEPNWPPEGTEEWKRRFLHYWLPYWKLDFPGTGTMLTSAILLWLPGVLWNYCFISPHVLFASNLSLAPKIALVSLLLLLFRWLRSSEIGEAARRCLYLTLAVPLVLLLSSSDYVAYFNSFYFETASFVFFFAFVAALLFFRRMERSTRSWGAFLLALMLLATAKVSNFYWPALGLLWAFDFGALTAAARRKAVRSVAIFVAAALAFTTIAFLLTRPPAMFYRANAINRFFYGVLTFSRNPGGHLERLGLRGAERCVGHTAFEATGPECMAAYADRLSLASTLSTLAREPGILPRMTNHVARGMQHIEVPYLRKFSIDNPIGTRDVPLNFWGRLKPALFPKGFALWLALAAYLAIFVGGVRQAGLTRELASVGLLATVATVVDMHVAILGDGKVELAKHLFLSNVLFDVATLAALNVAILVLGGFTTEKARCSRGARDDAPAPASGRHPSPT